MSRSSKIRAAEPLSEISRHANAIEAYRGRVKAQRERLQKRAVYWVGEKTSDVEAARVSQRNAKNMEIERRHELNAEMRKFNAELEVKESALGQVFDDNDCAVEEEDERDEERMFEFELGIAA